MNQNIRILIAEDESIVAIDLKKTLENWGYEVSDIVRTGEKAVQTATENIPDLILMDIMLEGEMTGIEAAREIRNQRDIPVIYLTAYANQSTLEQAKLTQPVGYILKPFNFADFEVVFEILNGKAK